MLSFCGAMILSMLACSLGTVQATPYPTQTAYPTQTPYPSPVPATLTPIFTATPEFKSLSWAELIDLILDDHTNWNIWTDEYNCVNFSMDLLSNVKKKNYEAWIVAVIFENEAEGHTFVAFPTMDRGEIWIEPQSDEAYQLAKIGEPLCMANNPYKCWAGGKLKEIIEPATCNYTTHHCR